MKFMNIYNMLHVRIIPSTIYKSEGFYTKSNSSVEYISLNFQTHFLINENRLFARFQCDNISSS